MEMHGRAWSGGARLHSYQDFYAHAIYVDPKSGEATFEAWTAGHTGDPWDHPNLWPSSYGVITLNGQGPTQHPPVQEPIQEGTREFNLRFSAAVIFSFKEMTPFLMV